MTKDRAFDREAKPLRRVVIKEEFVALTGHHIRALLLNQILYWTERHKDYDRFLAEEVSRTPEQTTNANVQPSNGWIYKSSQELVEEIMIGASVNTVLRHMDTLIEAGYVLRRNNPHSGWDRTYQYRADILAIQEGLHNLGYNLEGYPILQNDKCICQGEKCICQNEKSICQNDRSICQNDNAIPKITTEITTEKDRTPTTAKTDPQTGIEEGTYFGMEDPRKRWGNFGRRGQIAEYNQAVPAKERTAIAQAFAEAYGWAGLIDGQFGDDKKLDQCHRWAIQAYQMGVTEPQRVIAAWEHWQKTDWRAAKAKEQGDDNPRPEQDQLIQHISANVATRKQEESKPKKRKVARPAGYTWGS